MSKARTYPHIMMPAPQVYEIYDVDQVSGTIEVADKRPKHPKLEAQRDEAGRLPLSPSMQRVFDVLKTKMGSSWLHWEQLYAINDAHIGENRSTFQQRVNDITERGWLESKSEMYEPTKRKRKFLKLPSEFVTFFCGGCEQWKKGEDEYLCEECRG